MAMSDPIADMLTRIRNGCRAKHPRVDIPRSKMKEEIARILRDEGFIEGYERLDVAGKGTIRIKLRYDSREQSIITGIERISKPGCRVYVGKNEIPRILAGLGISILSTSQGIHTGQQSRRLGIGGEVLCRVW
ncbi:30S ribosomal protein S8 [candidate division TA06 bacterium DG_24]|jgi:small subunit ribosomal protein S8|uniref:Small ribosomal subunit protein uS8 n=3 Tax=Bacteria division TA06 TaxID=1156500 RepID=A0A0S8JIN6_UNCT6|nr:MAG: 30S ribosomal protein S8 [candidate division TA06 bacterium DG_24]KPK70901.1 MAG: 30S ribosomal protein S8 [candidate division TA06 bacterium SM23_40]KPL09575.1 MAG: 30S ribosomal protein S8 [candidate division TA06 bacterium SM1_40]